MSVTALGARLARYLHTFTRYLLSFLNVLSSAVRCCVATSRQTHGFALAVPETLVACSVASLAASMG